MFFFSITHSKRRPVSAFPNPEQVGSPNPVSGQKLIIIYFSPPTFRENKWSKLPQKKKKIWYRIIVENRLFSDRIKESLLKNVQIE